MTHSDILECREIARIIVKEAMVEHLKDCPMLLVLAKQKAFLVGLCVGSGFAGGGLALATARILFGVG